MLQLSMAFRTGPSSGLLKKDLCKILLTQKPRDPLFQDYEIGTSRACGRRQGGRGYRVGLASPFQTSGFNAHPDIKGPKWNEEKQSWEEYLSPLPRLSRAPSRRQPQLSGLFTSTASKTEDRGNDRDGDAKTTSKASSFARGQQGAESICADTNLSIVVHHRREIWA